MEVPSIHECHSLFDAQDDVDCQREALIAQIKGKLRQKEEIPLEALREAVANAIIHRDYGMRGEPDGRDLR